MCSRTLCRPEYEAAAPNAAVSTAFYSRYCRISCNSNIFWTRFAYRNTPASLANNLTDGVVFPIGSASHLALVAILQNILVLVLPIAVPHGLSTSFVMEKSGPQHCGPLRYKFMILLTSLLSPCGGNPSACKQDSSISRLAAERRRFWHRSRRSAQKEG